MHMINPILCMMDPVPCSKFDKLCHVLSPFSGAVAADGRIEKGDMLLEVCMCACVCMSFISPQRQVLSLPHPFIISIVALPVYLSYKHTV